MKTTHYLILNLLLAIVWTILIRSATIFQFALGFFLGFLILAVFEYALKSEKYAKRVKGAFYFTFAFLKLFMLSNFEVAWIILSGKSKAVTPAFIRYPVNDMTKFEALLMSQFISLTPGSVSVKLEKDSLHVHLLNMKEEKEAQENFNYLKGIIQRFTR
ncbi:MAG: Na+/H+ antiporter subunit E [Chlamydiia bacterium]|nr:Na+/H+ antiporter subunit E [Chlamydiia bacterium]